MSHLGVDLYRTHIPPEIIALLPESVARESFVIPVRQDSNLYLIVASSDPEDGETLGRLEFILNRPVTLVFATHEAIRFALAKYYPGV